MTKFVGKKNLNAEITIDYEKNKVKAKYPTKGLINEELIYASEHRTNVVGFLLLIIAVTIITTIWTNQETEILEYKTPKTCKIISEQISEEALKTEVLVPRIAALLGIPLGILILTMYTGLAIYMINPTNKKKYPENNAKWSYRRNWRILDLEKEYLDKAVKIDNKLIILEYSIVNWDYKYYGENPITKIETKLAEEPRKGVMDTDYICIITFKNKIRKGVLMYK